MAARKHGTRIPMDTSQKLELRKVGKLSFFFFFLFFLVVDAQSRPWQRQQVPGRVSRWAYSVDCLEILQSRIIAGESNIHQKPRTVHEYKNDCVLKHICFKSVTISLIFSGTRHYGEKASFKKILKRRKSIANSKTYSFLFAVYIHTYSNLYTKSICIKIYEQKCLSYNIY